MAPKTDNQTKPEAVSEEPIEVALKAELEAARKARQELADELAKLRGRAADSGLVLSPGDTTAPRPPLVATAQTGFDIREVEEAAIKRNLEYQEVVQLVREQATTGTFTGVPDEYAKRNWHFIVVGEKNDPRTTRRAEKLYAKGYSVAPPTVRAMGKGAEGMGDKLLIMGAPAEAYQNLLADKAMRVRTRIDRLHGRRQKEIEQKLRDSLPKGTDVHVALKIGSGNRGMAEVDREVAAALRDLPRS